jgi:protein SCO1/2
MRFAVVVLLLAASSRAVESPYRGGGPITGGEARLAVPPPETLKNIEIEQKIGTQLPLDVVFKDENGQVRPLREYFGKRPVVLNFAYYECPMLCGEVLNGMASAFGVLTFNVGKEFEVVTVSFNPNEGPELAAAKKKNFIRRYGRAGADSGWHFLTGSRESNDALAKAAGFRYEWDERTQQYAHAAAIMVASPQGRLTQYLYGVEYSPKDLRFALVEASQNKLGTLVDKVLLYCYHYDPRTGKYGALITRMLQVAGGITVLVLGSGLFLMLKLEPKGSQSAGRRKNKGGNA